MSDPASVNVSDKLVAAILAYFQDHDDSGELLSGVTFLQGWNAASEITGKHVTIVAASGEAQLAGLGPSGNETVTVAISARTHAVDDTPSTQQALEAAIDTLLRDRNLPAILTYFGSNITVMTAYIRGFTRDTVGNYRAYTRVLECFVAGKQPT